MKKQKICYIVTIPMTIYAFFIPQLKYLKDNGYDITVICQEDNNLRIQLGDIHYIPVDIPRGVNTLKMARALVKMIKIFKKNKYDMIQYSTPNAAFISSLAGCIAGIKIRNYHMMGIRYLGFQGISKGIFRFIEEITCMISTSIECVSKTNLKLCIREKLFKLEKGTVVWNGSTGGVDVTRFDISRREEYRKRAREELNISKDEFVFGFVGRITKDKGIEELVEAFLNLHRQAKLLFVGNIENDNNINSEILKTIKKNENIIVHSFVNDIEKYYAAIDCLVLPSYREGFGNVVIEAGAMGTGSIVSNIPGPKEIVANIGGKVCKVKDAESLRNCMDNYQRINPTLLSDAVKNKYNQNNLNRFIYGRKQQLLAGNKLSRIVKD